MKKSIKWALTGVLALALPTTALAATVNVSAVVFPKSGITLNFDSMSFEGAVGENDTQVKTAYAKTGVKVDAPTLTVRSKTNYDVTVAGSALTAAGGLTLDSSRLKVTVDSGTKADMPATGTKIITSGSASASGVTKNVSFGLDLTDTGNSYTDNTALTGLEADATLSTTITIAYVGL